MKTKRKWRELGLVLLSSACVSLLACAFVYRQGWTLYYGDAEAHLDIARRILDSRTPGYEQFGTVWLPLPHALMLPFVSNDFLWYSGLAGTIPAALCYVAACGFLFAAARCLFQSAAAGFAAAGTFGLNPNLLYLQAIPMTESLFFAGLFGMLFAICRFRASPSWGMMLLAATGSITASLTRYEGWVLIPFAAVCLLSARNKKVGGLLFLAMASFAPLYWLAHNWWFYGNALEFWNGPYSAKMIYQAARDRGMARAPGDGDWWQAARYFGTAVISTVGVVPVSLAAAGIFVALWRKALWPFFLLSLPPLVYLGSIHSGGTPIYIPQLWPFSYYNTRYALSVLPLVALCAGALAAMVRGQGAALAAAVVVIAGLLPWLFPATPHRLLCLEESRVNSVGRRAWTQEAADVLRREYRRGSGIFTSLGDLAGIYREAGIPLRETFNEGNRPMWTPTTRQPLLLLHEDWAVALAGDPVASAIEKLSVQVGPKYDMVRVIAVKNAPVVQIYRRSDPPRLPPQKDVDE